MIFDNPFPETCCFAIERCNSHDDGIHPLEKLSAKNFLSDNRRAEFFTGRRCAQIAMKEAGFPSLPVLRDSDRSPLWPLSIVGSISHGATLVAAIVKKQHSGVIGLGIDIEDLARKMRTNITKYTLTEWEIEKWSDADCSFTREARIIFSIKEAIYKCFHPIDKIYLGFHDAEVTEMDDHTFQARLFKNPFKRDISTPLMLKGKLGFFEDAIFSALKMERNDFR